MIDSLAYYKQNKHFFLSLLYVIHRGSCISDDKQPSLQQSHSFQRCYFLCHKNVQKCSEIFLQNGLRIALLGADRLVNLACHATLRRENPLFEDLGNTLRIAILKYTLKIEDLRIGSRIGLPKFSNVKTETLTPKI